MSRIHIKNFIIVILFIVPFFAMAQTITGTAKDNNGELLPYVKVTEYKATNTATTAKDGTFSIRVSMLPTKLIFNAIGYKEVTVAITNENAIDVVLVKKELRLQEKLAVGNAAKSRTTVDAPVAITYISTDDIKVTGRISLNDVLAYSENSFNSTNQTHADASSHLEVADLKGLGSSRMLILVNGKCKNLSAITHINNTYGKGEVGVDLQSIPVAAIDHIEILREGASAIYGSDAMSGVINIVLKNSSENNLATIYSGITTAGDGLEYGADLNGTFTNKRKDYVNYTVAFHHQDFTDRAGEPKKDVFALPQTNAWIDDNPDLGMVVGQPEMNIGNVYFNGGKPFKNGKGELYATIGVALKQGKSHSIFVTPYSGNDPNNIYNGEGFQPVIRTSNVDNMNVLGVKYNVNGFNFDLSGNYSTNKVELFVDESLNTSMSDSPKTFDNGGFRVRNTIANLNITKSFDKLNVAFGGEYKMEDFTTKQGEYDSWFGNGSLAFTGITHEDEIEENRNSFGAFANLDFDITKDFMIGAAARYDSYSDVGDQVTYKANTRYKIGNKATIRASYGTNFRAPALQQMFMNYQLLNTTERAAQNINDLEAETSTNINFGVFANPMKDVTVSLDYYKIDIDNRVVIANDATGNAFFTNAINTATQGIDFFAKYDNIRFPKGVLGFTLGANWNTTEIVGDINKPSSLAAVDIFNRTEQSRIETGRPNIRGNFGVNYKMDAFTVSLNNNYFGDVTWQHATDQSKDQTFAGKLLMDLSFNYKYSKLVTFNLAVNNLLNAYPDKIDNKGDDTTDLGGRFMYPYQVSQFGISGMNIRGGATLRF